MNATKTCSLSLGLPLAFVIGSLAGGQGGAPKADLAKVIGVVDMDRVARGYPKASKILEALKQMRATATESMKKEEQALDELRMKREALDPLSKRWIDADLDYESAKRRLEKRLIHERNRMGSERVKRFAEIYAEIKKAVGELAKRQGIQLVLHTRSTPEGASLERRFEVQQIEDVIYHHAKLDLTQDVIKILVKPN